MNDSKKYIFPLILLFTMSLSSAFSQDYTYHNRDIGGEWALGLRFGGASGISLKKYAINNKYAIEAVTSFGIFSVDKGIRTNVVFEKIKPLSDNEKLSAIFGGGVAMRLNPSKMGIAGIIGFDWRLARKFNMQVDWQPTWLFFDNFYGWNVAYTFRYNLNR